MPECDVLTREFMRKPDVFSEAFNAVIYGGKEVLTPSRLKEYDTTLLYTTESVRERGDVVLKDRDVIKIAYTDDQKVYLFLGIENQSFMDYVMPIRVMLYDALTYDQQLKRGKFKVETYRKLRIVPTITLVCYFGFTPWIAPKSLHEMLTDYPPEVLKYVPNYPLNLLDPYRMTDAELRTFSGELGCVFECLRAHDNSELLKNLLSSDERFNAISTVAAKLLNYRLKLNIDKSIDSQMENMNMCKAVQDMIKEAQNEVRKETQELIDLANNNAQLAKDEAQQAKDEAQQAKDEAQQAKDETNMVKVRTVANMMKMGNFTPEAITKLTGIPLIEVQGICAEL